MTEFDAEKMAREIWEHGAFPIGLSGLTEIIKEAYEAGRKDAVPESPKLCQAPALFNQAVEALQPFADFVSNTSTMWADERRIVSLNYDINKLTLGMFRKAAKVHAMLSDPEVK